MSNRSVHFFAAIAALLSITAAIAPAAAAPHHPKPFYTAPTLQLNPGACQLTQYADYVRCTFIILVANHGTVPTAFPSNVTDTALTPGATVLLLSGFGCIHSGGNLRCDRPSLAPGQSWQISALVITPTPQVNLDHCLVHDEAKLTQVGGSDLSVAATASVQLPGGDCKQPQASPGGNAGPPHRSLHPFAGVSPLARGLRPRFIPLRPALVR